KGAGLKLTLALPFFFLFLTPKTVIAQWEPLATFPGPLCTVYFMDQVGKPNIGFVSAYFNQLVRFDTNYYFWRTSDGGLTWQGIHMLPPDSEPALRTGARDFDFKDSLNGWMANYINFRTSDAGLTWQPLSPNIGIPDQDFGPPIEYHVKPVSFEIKKPSNEPIKNKLAYMQHIRVQFGATPFTTA
ncbi:MAG TPA: hypothetical protein VGM92_01670, partial [Candidatus Kapabacteria bacterium]